MKYIFNENFDVKQKEVPYHGIVDFVLGSCRDDIIVINNEAKSIIASAQKNGVIEDSNFSEVEVSRLISEEILVPYDKSEDYQSPFFTEVLNFWLQVTDKCNLDCSYCYIPSLNSKNTIRSDLFELLNKKIIEVPGLKTVNLKIAGGEPLLSFSKWKKGVVELRENLLKEKIELNMRLISNLTVLTDEMIEFFNHYQVSVSISLDGLGTFNDKNRIYIGSRKGTYATIKKNLDRLLINDIKPSVMVTATSENREGIRDLISFLVDRDITFRIADAKGGGISSDEFESLMDSSMSVLKEGVKASYPISRRVVFSDLRTHYPSSTPCSMGKNGAAIYLDGSVYFCHTEFEKGSPVGHLEENENLLGIIRRGKEKHYGLSDDCRSCEYRLICAGGCPLYRVNGKSPMCGAYKKILKSVLDLYDQEESEV
ncbi:radical SAM/SPASM domain-containing protein [Thalassolituus sp.]|jgi:uncharacterized protein|uniref:radical SAM/SPASM domain-containing protein n=1 Tax=Thalassolituus sp. TaxID=2030822 RepID=UPI002A80B5D0|nr:radical SAM protein [Thalassolituus sp.]|tara:strand:- start:9511 stop:10788 length:1278 start_codon:yes stop_codon:yes gene_type:complete